MGGDGGSIPTRYELVRTKQRGEQKDKDFDRLHRWSNCALTQEPLKRPIVACQLGRMYNKQTILEFLLEMKSGNLNEDDLKYNPDIVRHIKGIKVSWLHDGSCLPKETRFVNFFNLFEVNLCIFSM